MRGNPMKFSSKPSLQHWHIRFAHGGILTGHWEFDTAILLILFSVVAYSFLLPVDAPRGTRRTLIQSASAACFVGALVMAVLGFRSL